MGEQDQSDQMNAKSNMGSYNLFNNNNLFTCAGSNHSFMEQQNERIDIQNRVGKDITNMLQNQNYNNIQQQRKVFNNQHDSKGQINIQKGIPAMRNHNRTTSSILFANKDKNESKKFEDLAQQQQQQQVSQFNDFFRCGDNSNILTHNNNLKVNKSGNISQITNNYHQMARIPEQISCEKENNYTTQPQHPVQQQGQNIFTNNTNNNYIMQNNFMNKNINKSVNIFSSQNIISSFNQPQVNPIPIAPQQLIQNEAENEEIFTCTDSHPTFQSDGSTTHHAHLEYTREIISHLRQSENNFCAKGGYMGNIQKEINERMRGILLDWLVDVHFKFKLRTETLFISINLIDRYLEKINLPSSRLQLLGITSLFIAAKYEEVYSVPHIKDLVYVCDNAYVKEEIFDMEGSILQVLNFNILSVSSFRFLDYFIQFDDLGEKNYYLARYLIEIALLEYKMISTTPSLLASSAIYLVNKIRKRSTAWKESLIEITGYSESDIRPCAKSICHIVQTIDQRKYLNSLRKKFQKPQFLEVAKIKIEQRRENVPQVNNGMNNQQSTSSMNNNLSYNSSQSNSSSCMPFQKCASKEQEIIVETDIQQQQNSNNNFQLNNHNNGLNTNFLNNQRSNQHQNIIIQEQQFKQVEDIDIQVPIQSAIILIEKKISTLKEKPSNIIQTILTNRLYSEGAQPIELKVPSQLIAFLIEKKISNISNQQLWQLPTRIIKIIINSIFNPEKAEELGFVPQEFVNFMIEYIVNEQIIISQNSQKQNTQGSVSNNNNQNNISYNNQMQQNFFN